MCCLRMGVFIALVCAGFFVAGSPPAHAQVRRVAAELHGTLTDPTGAVITGASVVVRSEQTGHSWSATTTKDGDYVIDGLPAGNYEVHVQQNGFAESVKNVTLAAGGAVNLPITLSVAAIAQQVNVSSSPVNGGMDSQQIRESSARDLGEKSVRQELLMTSRSAACSMRTWPRPLTGPIFMGPAPDKWIRQPTMSTCPRWTMWTS
jgi:hypothetical protein